MKTDGSPDRYTKKSEKSKDRLDIVRQAVRDWRVRVKAPDQVDKGSSIDADDQVFPPMPCSQLAWYALTTAVEHLDAGVRLLDEQVVTGGPILPSANSTVLRGALVGACQAVVLLVPPARDVRTTYGLQIAHEEYRQVLSFRAHMIDHPGLVAEARKNAAATNYLKIPEERKVAVATMLSQRGISKRLTDTDMIRKAGELVHSSGADSPMLQLMVEMEWRLGSGAAHGRFLMAMHRPGGHVVESGRTALFGASIEEVANQITSVSLLLSEAWRVWDLRRISPNR